MLFKFFSLCLLVSQTLGEDYYELLGLKRDADQKMIRQAFKKLAVTLHPDKNSDDPEAHIKFIKYTSAYEVLKDPDLRKKYDLYGEEGLNGKNTQQNYHSWSYYQENFGIYDDDPQVVTLNRNDFHDNVMNSEKIWMVNFYSPMCSHCHTLAPVWRRIAKDFEGVIRVGAVNCEDDWSLCRKLNIQSYPTLLFYPKNSKIGTRFVGRKNYDEISEYIMESLNVRLAELSATTFKKLIKDPNQREKPWLIFTCGAQRDCLTHEEHLKTAAIFENILNVGTVTCSASTCDSIKKTTSAVFLPGLAFDINAPILLDNLDTLENLIHQVLEQLPEPQELTADDFERIQGELSDDENSHGWLLCFYIGHVTELDLQLKRLPGLIQGVNLGKINCGRHQQLCSSRNINRYPMWGVLKPGGAFELSHGKDTINELAKFAENAIRAENVWALPASRVLEILERRDPEPWFLDFYAPWCPPCMQFLPEVRKASLEFEKSTIKFGTIDCTVHSAICRQYNIRSYPTAMLINGTTTMQFNLQKTADNVVEFINEAISPTVFKLNSRNFHETLGKKDKKTLWVVDYFAPWCGPCQQLAPEWTALAKALRFLDNVKIASVDCEADAEVCRGQGVRSYPTIRLYPMGSEGLSSVALYNGHRDASSLLRWIIQFLPIKVKEFNEKDLEKKVIGNKKETWVIDYFAPWCGHCQVLEPHVILAAQMLEGRVKFAKVNCDSFRGICAKAGVNAYPTLLIYRGEKKLNAGRNIEGHTAEGIRDSVLRVLKEKWAHDEL